MPYWGEKSCDSDFAFDSVGAYIYLLNSRMKKDIENVKAKNYPEQSILASLKCVRLILNEYPKMIGVHFKKRDYEFARQNFTDWYTQSVDNIPKKYSEGLLAEARKEFLLYDKMFDR